MNFYSYMPSPIGRLLLVSDQSSLTGLYMDTGIDHVGSADQPSDHLPVFEEAKKQLNAYFEKDLSEFDLPLKLTGTEFQKSVWSALRSIPYGAVTSYGALARLIGNEKAVRAVGLANSKNPISIVIPCHRVIGANGTLTGYGGGLERKEFLLALERGQTSLLAWSSAQNGDFPAGGKKLRIANKHCLGDVASRIETRVR